MPLKAQIDLKDPQKMSLYFSQKIIFWVSYLAWYGPVLTNCLKSFDRRILTSAVATWLLVLQ